MSDHLKLRGGKLASMFQTERWFNGVSIHNEEGQEYLKIYSRSSYPPKHKIPKEIEGTKVILIIEAEE